MHAREYAPSRPDLASDELHLHAFRGKPLREIVWVGPHLKYSLHWSIEGAVDDEHVLAGGFPFQVLREAIPDASFAVEIDGSRGLIHEPGHAVGMWELSVAGRREAELAELVAQPAAKLLIRAGNRDSDEFAALVAATLEGAYEATHSSLGGLVEISAAGVTKASGLAWVAARLGVDAADAVAFGDMLNDVPMLAWAGWAVAMGNAHPAVKEVADEITVSNDEDGVAVWLERAFG